MYLKNNDDAKALWALYHYYENGWCGVKVNKENSIICLKKSAEHGHAGAAFQLIKILSDSAGQNSAALIQEYISDDHIRKCYSKIEEFNDGHFYNQDEYIALLEKIKDQNKTTNTSTNNTIRHRIV